ncbi:phosphatase 2C-like domain-containing protein [Pseudomassariella vexata]|uniref:Protein phosphatase n=1 Tax=Pseudomassariella vexata TaxID=1141098 RepID=A0A1Y2DEC4_9PEZI|nr:phosphatase 2C-like domain-containing protein [Pseudomassariella vexata]ORY57557.1 phosphatase 2C-like domain-containing protein [Pseudomassariella vexata]
MRILPTPLLASTTPKRPLRRILFSHRTRWRIQQLNRYTLANAAPGSVSPSIPDSSPCLPFRFETGYGLFAKRAPRPFPPPFLSPPSGSFSDPLSTHHQSRNRRALVNGELIRGMTNGDDAVYTSDYFVCVNDGVGAWSMRPRGHAGLWSRLILHFWVAAIQDGIAKPRLPDTSYEPDPVQCLQLAYERTLEATSAPNDCQGTTTAAGAQLYYKGDARLPNSATPLLYVTNLGDSQIMVVRPKGREMVYKSKEQWHWFDCPRQLGTNSPDTPSQNAVVDIVELKEGDVVLAMSDGVIDNLWEHEIVENVTTSIEKWESRGDGRQLGSMEFVAGRLKSAAQCIALDPFAESPFMEHAIDEGLASEGGKLDDISVVAALVCRRNTDCS